MAAERRPDAKDSTRQARSMLMFKEKTARNQDAPRLGHLGAQ